MIWTILVSAGNLAAQRHGTLFIFLYRVLFPVEDALIWSALCSRGLCEGHGYLDSISAHPEHLLIHIPSLEQGVIDIQHNVIEYLFNYGFLVNF